MYCYAQPDGGQRQVPDNYTPLATEIVCTQAMLFDDVMTALADPVAFKASHNPDGTLIAPKVSAAEQIAQSAQALLVSQAKTYVAQGDYANAINTLLTLQQQGN